VHKAAAIEAEWKLRERDDTYRRKESPGIHDGETFSRLGREMLPLTQGFESSKHATLRTEWRNGMPAGEAQNRPDSEVVRNLVINASEAIGRGDGE